MYKKKPGVDIIAKVLDALYEHNKDALFVMSLMHQYEERGSLSKKQLQGLYLKAKKVPDMPSNWLGTLEAIILRMPTRYKPVEPVVAAPIFSKDESLGQLIDAILTKYPEHKRVRFLKTLYEQSNLQRADIEELHRFGKVLGVK